MITKIFLFFFAALFYTLNASAQTIEENINRQMNDPKTEEKAAKADAMLIDKTIISDGADKSEKTKRDHSNKKRKCIKKSHHKH